MIKDIRTTQGFTLVEMVMVIVIIGIIGGMVAVFIRAPVQGYFDLASRAEITDAADTALRRVGRDLRLALPNSVRVSATQQSLGFLPTITGGRYRAEGSGNVLDVSEETTSFDVIGGMAVAPNVNDHVVVYNLGFGTASAYGGGNRSNITGIVGSTITVTAKTFPFESPGRRFHVIPNAEKQVAYVCDGGTLCRHSNLAFDAALPTTCPAGVPVLAQYVNTCVFQYDQLINQRNGLVTLLLSLTKNDETVTLYHEIHVSNVP